MKIQVFVFELNIWVVYRFYCLCHSQWIRGWLSVLVASVNNFFPLKMDVIILQNYFWCHSDRFHSTGLVKRCSSDFNRSILLIFHWYLMESVKLNNVMQCLPSGALFSWRSIGPLPGFCLKLNVGFSTWLWFRVYDELLIWVYMLIWMFFSVLEPLNSFIYYTGSFCF